MTARDKMAASTKENAGILGVGLPLILSSLAEQYFGIQLDTQTAMAIAAVLGHWGAKIERAL